MKFRRVTKVVNFNYNQQTKKTLFFSNKKVAMIMNLRIRDSSYLKLLDFKFIYIYWIFKYK